MAKKETAETIKSVILTDTDTGNKYELDFNRESVVFAEKRGFEVGDVSRFPATKISELFWYSFRMHHKRLTQVQTDAILEKMGGMKTALVQRLIELYMQAGYTGVIASDDEEDEKNPVVTVEL